MSASDRGLLQEVYELDIVDADGQRLGTSDTLPFPFLALTPEAQAAMDELCALWIDRAPRFGAVAAHFPESLRKRRFVAGFWAPEVLLFGDFYLSGGRCWTRPLIDKWAALLVERAGPACPVECTCWPDNPSGVFQKIDRGKPRFWSPELPEVRVVERAVGTEVHAAYGEGVWRRFAPVVHMFLLLLCLSLPAGAQTMFGTVTRITDGDTLVVGKAKIRLYGIDAPEGSQTCTAPNRQPSRCGDSAEGFLASLAPPGSHISCRVLDTDRYGRLVARCAVGDKDLSAWMVRAGWAVAFRKYSLQYVPQEDEARAARRGRWAGSFVVPELWRKGVRQ